MKPNGMSGKGRDAHVYLWAPLGWNEPFLGIRGGGSRTLPQWLTEQDLVMFDADRLAARGAAGILHQPQTVSHPQRFDSVGA